MPKVWKIRTAKTLLVPRFFPSHGITQFSIIGFISRGTPGITIR